jgi:hypothetical protein
MVNRFIEKLIGARRATGFDLVLDQLLQLGF